MTPEHWREVEELFQAAAEMGGEARDAFLGASCPGDTALRREVESLLRAHDLSTGFLDRPAVEALPPEQRDDSPGSWTGRRIGPYTVLRELGRGGMGRVFLAARSDAEYETHVAIKVFGPAFGADHLESRFRRERQILANLDHPNIARLHDGGTLPEGLPYFVMDWVDGTPIDEYCDRERLPVDERLALFRQVCAAVQHAHQNLVVHRDLKPANILVDGTGVPKLLDFGVAKLLEADPGGEREATRTWLHPMTLQYASPEQIFGQPVTTATDVYSLGVILYGLLCGRLPYEVRDLPLPEAARRISELEPPRPSAAVRAPGSPSVREIARARGTQPSSLARRLAGDLDNVVLVALRKDSRRRYPSAHQLSEDLKRHLESLPVSARRDTFVYRAGKFLRRNRIAASLGTALLTAVLVFSVVAVSQARRTALERDKSQEALGFLVSIFRQSDPDEPHPPARADELSAREILDRGSRRVTKELAAEPEVRATLLEAIGEAYLGLGLPEEARPLLEQARDAARRSTGPASPLFATALSDLGQAHLDAADYPVAEKLLRQALALRRKAVGPVAAPTLGTVRQLAQDLLRQGRLGEAETLLRDTLKVARLREADPAGTADLLGELGDLRGEQGDPQEQEALYRETLDLRERTLGAGDPRVADAMASLGEALSNRGEYSEAVELFSRARALLQPLLDEDHPRMLRNLNDLGMAYMRQGRYAEAGPLFRRLVALRRDLRGERNPEFVVALNNLATVESRCGLWADSARHYQKVLSVVRSLFGEKHPWVARSLFSAGRVALYSGRVDEAEGFERKALEILRALPDSSHDATTRVLLALGQVALARGDVPKAEKLIAQVLETRRRLLPPGHPLISDAEFQLGAVRLAQGRYAEAEPLLLSGYLDEDGKPLLHGSVRIHVLEHLVRLYRAWGKGAQERRYAADLDRARSDLRTQVASWDAPESSLSSQARASRQ